LSSYRLTKQQRLSKKDHSGKEIAIKKTSELVCIAKENPLKLSRVKAIVPKKYCAKATQRNKIKRWVRESFRLQQEAFQGVDLIIIARFKVNQLTYQGSFKAVKAMSDVKKS
jgi:ribonuclease P protein component